MTSYSRPASLRYVRRRRRLSRDLAPGRHGADGHERWSTRAYVQRFTSDIRTASVLPTIRGGPEPYSADHQQPCEPWLFVLREEAENYDVPEPRRAGRQRKLRRLQEGRDRRRRLRRLPAVKQRQDRSRAACGKDVRKMAQRRSSRLITGFGLTRGGTISRTVERFRVCEFRWFWRSAEGFAALSEHTYAASIRAASRSPAKECPAAATIRIGSFVVGFLTARSMTRENRTMD